MKHETAFEQLKRKNPRLAKRIRAVTLFLSFYSGFIGFMLGLIAPTIGQDIANSALTLGTFFLANPMLAMLTGGFVLGLNLGSLLVMWRPRR